MKQFKLLALGLLLIIGACKQQDRSKTVVTSVDDKLSKIEVIDFYGTHRCITCKAIEANTKYTIDTYFSNEPKVTFKTINVDDEANFNIAESFEAAGTALFLNVINKGEEQHIDLTDFAFSKGKEQQIFSYELKNKIDAILKKL